MVPVTPSFSSKKRGSQKEEEELLSMLDEVIQGNSRAQGKQRQAYQSHGSADHQKRSQAFLQKEGGFAVSDMSSELAYYYPDWSDTGEDLTELAQYLGVPYKVITQQTVDLTEKPLPEGAIYCTGCRSILYPWQKRCKICDRVNPAYKPWAKPPSD